MSDLIRMSVILPDVRFNVDMMLQDASGWSGLLGGSDR